MKGQANSKMPSFGRSSGAEDADAGHNGLRRRAVAGGSLDLADGLLIEPILVDHDLRCWQVVIPKDDQTLKRELLRNFLSYLGVEPKNG